MGIREYVIKNFINDDISELEGAINDSIDEGDETTLPGMGVLFEILWKNSSTENKKKIVNCIFNSIKKETI